MAFAEGYAGSPLLQNRWIRLLRPIQWSKNAVVLAALVFGQVYDDPGTVAASLGAVIAFCLISSAGYIFNDLLDADRDKLHPVKRSRPIASGAIPARQGIVLAVVLAVMSFQLAMMIEPLLALMVVLYGVLMAGYSLAWKRIPVLDVAIIATGFLLRAIAGGVAIDVRISGWLMVCTVLLALFLGFSKRRHEMVTLGERASRHRDALRGYTPHALDLAIRLTATAALAAYTVYTLTAESVPENHAMLLTVPIVAFALARYLHLVYGKTLGGAPEVLLFRDLPLFTAIVSWGVAIGLIFWIT